MQVYGPSHVHGPQSLGAPHRPMSSQSTSACASSPIQDELQLSEAALKADAAQLGPTSNATGIRQDLVNSIRSQIASGAYETPEKLDIAVSRLLDAIG